MKNYLSTSEIKNELDKKWKEYKNIHENGYSIEERNAGHKGMLVVRSVERDLIDRAKKSS